MLLNWIQKKRSDYEAIHRLGGTLNRSKAAWDTCLKPWMRKGLICLCFLITAFASPMAACAFQVTLAWDSNPEPDVSGYKVYYGEQSRNYTYYMDVGNFNICVISGLTPGRTYHFAVTAYDIHGNESDFSEELEYQVPAQQPDTDNDGVPDDWEIDNGLNPSIGDAYEDPDEDGFTNLQEYFADTDPRDPNSFPQLSEPKLNLAIILLLLNEE